MNQDSFAFYAAATLVTLVALFCFAEIKLMRSRGNFSIKEFTWLFVAGPFSWASQIGILYIMDFSGSTALYVFLFMFIAFCCFGIAIWTLSRRKFSGQTVAAVILMGEFFFPVLLITLLPEGLHTLLDLI
jgi:hypothetical protein